MTQSAFAFIVYKNNRGKWDNARHMITWTLCWHHIKLAMKMIMMNWKIHCQQVIEMEENVSYSYDWKQEGKFR